MRTGSERWAAALLLAAGFSTVFAALSGPWTSGTIGSGPLLADPPLAALLHHHRVLMTALGLGAAAAAWWPPLRLAALPALVLSKAAFLSLAVAGLPLPFVVGNLTLVLDWATLVLALSAGAIYLRVAFQQARWDGALPFRPEAW